MTLNSATSTGMKIRGVIGLLGLFAGLCAIFVLVVTVAEGWSEHVQQSWPEVTAAVQMCSVDTYQTFKNGQVLLIVCQVRYRIGGDEVAAKVHSRSTRSTEEIGLMQEWVDKHQPGSSMVVRYDPGKHTTAVLTETDMPMGEPRTPGNVRLLLMFSVACACLLIMARALAVRDMG